MRLYSQAHQVRQVFHCKSSKFLEFLRCICKAVQRQKEDTLSKQDLRHTRR